MTICYNNSSKKLSRVLDVLGGFLKKENHQNLIPDMMGAFLDGPPHSKCFKNAKNVGGRSAHLLFSEFYQNGKPI